MDCTRSETERAPACALHREKSADDCDPQKRYRLAPGVTAFAASFTSNFVIEPHDDSGGAETVNFLNPDGPPPEGKSNEWAFAVAGHILRLPAQKNMVTTVYLRGTGLWHGTLPTSYKHNNHGSALVSKRKTLAMIKSHIDGCPEVQKAIWKAKRPKIYIKI